MKKIISGIFLLLFCSCMQNPIPPSWDTEINLPIASRNILMRDVCTDSIDSVSLFEKSFSIDPIWVKDILVLDSICQDTSLVFTDIKFNLSSKDTVSFTLGDVMPEIKPFQGQWLPTVPAKDSTLSDSFRLPLAFEYIDIDSGFFVVGFKNNLPIVIDSVCVSLMISETLNLYYYFINPGDSAINSCNLSGKTVQNPINYAMHIWTREKTDSTMIDTAVNVETSVELFIRTLSAMTGKFPPCTSSMVTSLALTPYAINSAKIDSGYFEFHFENPIHGEFGFFAEDTAECNFFNIHKTVVNGNNDTTIVIRNGTINPVNRDSLRLNTCFYPTAGSVWDTLDQNDTFRVSIRLYSIYVSQISAHFDSTIIASIPTYNKTIDYYNIDPTVIKLDSVWFFINMYNGIDANPEIILNVRGARADSVKTLTIARTITPDSNSFRIGGDSVVNFINLFPESISVSGEVRLTGDIGVTSTDFISGEAGFEMPARIIINDTLKIAPDTVIGISIPQQIKDAPIESTNLKIQYANPTPLQGNINVFMSTDSTSYGECIYTLPFEPATAANPRGEYTTRSPVVIKEYLKYDRLWPRIVVNIFSNEKPDTIAVLPKDRFMIKSLLKIKVRVGKK
ncbi:MAG: hypothetical protein PHX21_01995 [bacterium]|nr:hypothetical protein [bacterium]